MKKTRLAICLTALLLLALALVSVLPGRLGGNGARQEGNLVVNGDFSAVTDGMPDGWTPGMWVNAAGVSYLEAETLEDGTTAALVENAAANDARFEQRVAVRENATYRLSARVRAQGVDPGKTGANISFLDVYGTSECAYDTDGEWTTLTLYARTGKRQHEATVCVRVGGYGSEATGKAWFTDVELVEVDSLPTGVQALNIAPQQDQSAPKIEREPVDLTIPVLLLAAAAYIALAAYIARRTPLAGDLEEDRPPRRALAMLLLGACALRAVLAARVPGYGVDMNCFTAWAWRMAETGPWGFYEEGYFCDYPPAYMLVLGLLGGVARLLNLSLTGPGGQYVLKLLPVLYDALLALALYRFTRRELGERAALSVAGLIALNPAFIITGSCWGQIDALLALLLALLLMRAREGRWQAAIPLFALAVLAKPQAGLLAPLGVAALCKELAGRDRRRNAKPVAVGVALGLALTAAIVLPFSIGQEDALWLVDKYRSTLSGYDFGTLSTGNLMFLLGGNWVNTQQPVLGSITYAQIGAALMALSFAAGIAVYLKGEGRGRLMLASALTMQAVFCLGLMMHERYVLPALALLLLAFVETGDARLLCSAVLSSAASAINVGVVLAYDYLIAPHLWLGYAISVVQLAALGLTCWSALSLSLGRAPARMPKPLRRDVQKERAERGEHQARDARRRAALLAEKDGRARMTRRDWAILLTLTLLYAALGFYRLGATKAPQGGYASSAEGETAVFDLGEVQSGFRIYYYGGVSDTQFSFAVSDDGISYGEEHDAYFAQGECYKWRALRSPVYGAMGEVTGERGNMLSFTGRYVRLTYKGAGAALWEVGFVDGDGKALPVAGAVGAGGYEGRQGDPSTLVDEQDTVPDKPSYYNSMYFDEVYHARTGYEHAHGLYTYETTHPPLGKVFMSWCIRLWGMTPFAWRFAGALTGVLMIPALYLLARELFGRTRWAALCALLLALDNMHYTQTRIATIDSFPVLFMVLMFYFMLRWSHMSFLREPLAKTLVPLALSGFCMGLAIASKWIGCYGAAGLALFFFARLGALWRQSVYARAHRQENEAFARAADVFTKNALITLAACVVFFVIVPLTIYCLSYIPYLRAYGPVRLDLTTLERIWRAQVTMYEYHSNLVSEHSFASPWYEWPVMATPMWYYQQTFPTAGKVGTIMAFGNPAVWWTGLAAILLALLRGATRCALPALGLHPVTDDAYDRALPMICTGFLSAYLPWMLISRLTFIYHYFASVPFIILATAQVLRYVDRRRPRLAAGLCAALCAAALVLFFAFLPLGAGFEIPRAWFDAMNWFPGWMYC